MSTTIATARSIMITRWVARIWTIPVFGVALLMVFTPDRNVTEAVPAADWFLLSFWGVAILGLLIAWRWEFLGGTVTIATMCLRELAWVVLKGHWWVNFLIVWLFVVPPAILFLVAWRLERKSKEA